MFFGAYDKSTNEFRYYRQLKALSNSYLAYDLEKIQNLWFFYFYYQSLIEITIKVSLKS